MKIKKLITLIAVSLLLSFVSHGVLAQTSSPITVGGTDYTLFTNFTATGGSEGIGVFTYGNMVDGNTSTSFHVFTSPAYVEFNTDDPIIPKGYIFNTYQAGNFYPQTWVLKAKADATDDWTELSSYSGQTLSGQEFQYACSNDDNTDYKYFRFEASNEGNNIWLTEIRLYGFENLNYTHLTVKAATCTEVGIMQECYKRGDGKYFTDETGATELAESDVIAPMIAHTGVHHEADENHIEYWQCSVCSKYFSNEGRTTEIIKAQTFIVKYLDDNGALTTLNSDATMVSSTTTSWTDGWYIVYDDMTIADRISASGTVNLILGNGATLTAVEGITVGSDATLNIYAQTDDEVTMGALVASAAKGSNNAAIGGVPQTNFGVIVINGGKITATTNKNCGAPIGGGYKSNGGSITINGGIVSATAGDYSSSAGIGGGNSGYVASVTLNGGIITATGDAEYVSAGIGTGALASRGTMTITIGSGIKKLVATRGYNSDCIGKAQNALTTVNVVFKNGETTVTGDAKDVVFYDTGEDGNCRVIELLPLTLAQDENGIAATLNGNYTGTEVFTLDNDIAVNSVSFSRTFTANQYSTIILPFDVPNAANCGEFYTFDGVKHQGNAWIADVTKVTEVKANTPYLFKPSTATPDLTKDVKKLVATTSIIPENDKWDFVGMYQYKEWAEDADKDYGFAGEEDGDIQIGEFVKVGAGASINPFRCYLTYKGTSNDLSKSAVELPDRIIVRVTNPDATDDDSNTEIITPVSEITAEDGIKVWSYNHTAYISAQPGMEYRIVDMGGRTIRHGVTASNREEVSLNGINGIVIVKIGNKTFKIKY